MARRTSAGGPLAPGKLVQRRHLATSGHPKGGPEKPGPALASLGRTLRGAPLRSLTRAGLLRTVPGYGINRS
jgi:hypothetical protein